MWESGEEIDPVAPGKVPQTNISYSEKFPDGGNNKEIDVWVSDNFGLAVGIRVH